MARDRSSMIAAGALGLLSSGALAQSPKAPGVIVYPESPTTVELSNRDINRIICGGGVFEDYKYSGEKGILVEATGGDAFIKFQIMETGAAREYVTARSEFFFRCNGRMFTLFAEPRDVPSRTVHLGSPDDAASKTNAEIFNPLSDEERAVVITQNILKEATPASFSRVLLDEPFEAGILPGADVRRRAHFHIEGVGLSAAEFLVRAARPVRLNEMMFASRRFGTSIYAITIDNPQLKAGEIGRVVIVYRGGGE